MKRSIYSCLASLALIALSQSAQAQVLLGHTRLAPVALEARCQVADGMIGSWTQLTALGADPLHAAILLADEQSQAASDDPVGCDSSEAPAASELDASDLNDVYCGDAHCVDGAAKADIEYSTPEESAKLEYVENPCPQESYCCPFADLAANEPIDVDDLGTVNAPIAPAAAAAAAAAAVGINGADAPAPQQPAQISVLAGSSPMIFLLQEEYLPYDLACDTELNQQVTEPRFPVEIGFFPFKGLATSPLADRPTPLRDDIVYGPHPRPYSPSDEQEETNPHALGATEQEIAGNNEALGSVNLPIACYVDSAIDHALVLIDGDGPIAPWIDARRIGETVGPMPFEAISSFLHWTQPAWPVLTAPSMDAIPAVAPPPAPQNTAPLVLAGNPELEVAASTLHYAASRLERFAGTLRGLGNSLSRVASGAPTLRR